MPEDRAETAELILSELVTNAIQHGRSRQIAVRANMPAAGTVHVEVDDFTPSAAPQPSNASADEENGRGLWLVDHLAQELGGTYGHSRDGTVAWCRVPLQEPPNH